MTASPRYGVAIERKRESERERGALKGRKMIVRSRVFSHLDCLRLNLFFDNLNRSQQEASFALTTNDPSGFNAIDTLAWGAIGHALGYFALATNSLSAAGFDAKPF